MFPLSFSQHHKLTKMLNLPAQNITMFGVPKCYQASFFGFSKRLLHCKTQKLQVSIKIKLHNCRIQMFASIWNRSTSNKRAVKSLQNRQKLSSQVLRQKRHIWTCVLFKLFGLCARISLQTSLISFFLCRWSSKLNYK